MTDHKINPATVAHLAGTLATQAENLRSDGEFVNFGIKWNHYRRERIRELTMIALLFIIEARIQVAEYESSTFQERTP